MSDNEYKRHLDSLFMISSLHKDMLNKFVFELCLQDKGDEYVSIICKSRDSVIYRIESINWHMVSMCMMRNKCDEQLCSGKDEWRIVNDSMSIYYMFDNVIFNLVSLYDYYSTFISLYFFGPSKGALKWNSLVKSAYKNKISNYLIADDIIEHDRMWTSRLQDFRASVIHHYFDIGRQGWSWSAKNGCSPVSSLLLTIPKKMCKKLGFQSEQGDYDNFDLNYGAIEVVTRSLSWFRMMTSKIIDSHPQA
jgi:hypothetical protein